MLRSAAQCNGAPRLRLAPAAGHALVIRLRIGAAEAADVSAELVALAGPAIRPDLSACGGQ
jgi:hypothetical protein